MIKTYEPISELIKCIINVNIDK